MSAPRTTPARKVLGRLSLPERTFVTDALRAETVGGVLLLVAAVTALIWTNIPALHGSYESVSHFHFGPGALGLNLSVAHWAADGLLAVFFFVAGIELKRELVAGDLRDPKAAALPVVAALCGMAVPALVYTLTNLTGGGSLQGWAVPTATDIAFALAVLAVIGTSLPSALRAFLLTLAVVDDLFAILIIAVFFTSDIDLAALGGAVAGLVVFWLLLRRGVRGWYVYVPLALVVWALMYNSGVHATIAGVAMGLMLRCHRHEGEARAPGERVEHLVRPLSAGLAVPLFALFSAGVTVSGGALGDVFTRPETLGVVLGLVVGKAVGIFGGTWLTARFTRASLSDELAWADVFAVATLAGIGFTVSLLIGELAFDGDAVLTDEVKAAVLTASLIAAVLATVLLKVRNAKYRRMCEDEERDEDLDGIPDIYEQDDPAYHLRMAEIFDRKAAEHRRIAALKEAEARGEAEALGSADDAGLPKWRAGQASRTTVRHDLTGRYKRLTRETAMSAPDGSPVGAERSIGQLFASATTEMSALVHDEIALAKAQLKQDVIRGAMSGGAFTVAAGVLVFSLPMLNFALAYGIRTWSDWNLALCFLLSFAANVLVAVVLVLVGVFFAKKAAKGKGPQKVAASVKETAGVLQNAKPHTRPEAPALEDRAPAALEAVARSSS